MESYKRSYITLKVIDKAGSNYGKARGYAKIEKRRDNGVLTMYVENLETKLEYNGFMVYVNKDTVKYIDCGAVEMDSGGLGKLKKNFKADNIEGKGFSIYDISAVGLITPDYNIPLIGFTTGEIAGIKGKILSCLKPKVEEQSGLQQPQESAEEVEDENKKEDSEAAPYYDAVQEDYTEAEDSQSIEEDNEGFSGQEVEQDIENREDSYNSEVYQAPKDDEDEAYKEELDYKDSEENEDRKENAEENIEECEGREGSAEQEAHEEQQSFGIPAEDNTQQECGSEEEETALDSGQQPNGETNGPAVDKGNIIEDLEDTDTGANDDYMTGLRKYIGNIVNYLKEIKPFECEMPGYKWWRIDLSFAGGVYDHYLVGFYYENNNIRYLTYGMPGRFCIQEQPFGGMTGFVYWHPTNGNDRKFGEEGYWILHIDANTGRIAVPLIPTPPPLFS